MSSEPVGKNVTIYPNAKLIGRENIRFGNNVIIDDFAFIYAKKEILIGSYVHIACFTSISGGEELVLGDFSAVSHGCRILTATDDFRGWGFGNSTVPEKYRNVKRARVEVGRFCVIGANSVVLPGVRIGEGATVGAGSVVTRDLEPWGVYIGNHRIGERSQALVEENFGRFCEEQKWPKD
jgi:galactoside O-acetyltransferase